MHLYGLFSCISLPKRFILSINLSIWIQHVWVNNHGATKSITRLIPNMWGLWINLNKCKGNDTKWLSISIFSLLLNKVEFSFPHYKYSCVFTWKYKLQLLIKQRQNNSKGNSYWGSLKRYHLKTESLRANKIIQLWTMVQNLIRFIAFTVSKYGDKSPVALKRISILPWQVGPVSCFCKLTSPNWD